MNLYFTHQAKKDLKKYADNNNSISEIQKMLELLQENGVKSVPKHKKPHKLKGNFLDITNAILSLIY